jgi:hypothetical protein
MQLQGKDTFLEEAAGLLAAINRLISLHERVTLKHEELIFTLARIENKLDAIQANTCKTELIR